jgi:hypothetical protein
MPLCSTISAVPFTLIPRGSHGSTDSRSSIERATCLFPSLTFLYFLVERKYPDCGCQRKSVFHQIQMPQVKHPARPGVSL